MVIYQNHLSDKTFENVIIQLHKAKLQQKSRGLVYSIYFNTILETKIANPYLKNFGIISHLCQGTGIIFKVPESWRDKQGRLHVHQ